MIPSPKRASVGRAGGFHPKGRKPLPWGLRKIAESIGLPKNGEYRGLRKIAGTDPEKSLTPSAGRDNLKASKPDTMIADIEKNRLFLFPKSNLTSLSPKPRGRGGLIGPRGSGVIFYGGITWKHRQKKG